MSISLNLHGVSTQAGKRGGGAEHGEPIAWCEASGPSAQQPFIQSVVQMTRACDALTKQQTIYTFSRSTHLKIRRP